MEIYKPQITGLINQADCKHRFAVYGLPQFNCPLCGLGNPELKAWDGDWNRHPWLDKFSLPQLRRFYARGSISNKGRRLMGAPGMDKREFKAGELTPEQLKRKPRMDKQHMRAACDTRRGMNTAQQTGKRKFTINTKFTIATVSNGIVVDVELGFTLEQLHGYVYAKHHIVVERSELTAQILECMTGGIVTLETDKGSILQITREGK